MPTGAACCLSDSNQTWSMQDQGPGPYEVSPAPTQPSGEQDPHGRLPHTPGAKLDLGKAPVRRGALNYFPRALTAVAAVSHHGAQKYIWEGWRHVPDMIERYGNAGVRHILAAAIEGPYDPDSKLLHAAHEAWNALAVLEKMLEDGMPLVDPAAVEDHQHG